MKEAKLLNFNSIKIDINDAFQCLWFRKFRTILSTLGVAIGTMALISMLSISEGAKQEAQKKIASMGINTIRIQNDIHALILNKNDRINLATGLTNTDYTNLKNHYKLAGIAKYRLLEDKNVIYSQRIINSNILLVNEDWFFTENIVVEKGRSINTNDVSEFMQVCLLGFKIAKDLKAKINSLISWQDNSCEVIGILSEKGALMTEGSSLASINFDELVIVPINQFSHQLAYLSGITVKFQTSDLSKLNILSDKIKSILANSHQVKDYLVVTPATLLEKAQQEQKIFALVMGTIAGLSLLVGGIGILNVMLAHVAEQTREIGLRIAVGSSKNRILQLFLMYSFTLTSIGTLFGILAGMLLALGIQYYAKWPVNFSIISLTLGPMLSLVCGIVFGLFPAYKASEILPNTTLRQV